MRTRAETEFETWAKQLPRAELGGLLKEYIAESNHGSWDGFDRHDMTGIRKFLADLMVYHKGVVESPGMGKDHFATHTSNVNPVP